MEKQKHVKTGPDLNGNEPKVTKKNHGRVKDEIVTSEGRVFYSCRFCNKVFPNKKTRTMHLNTCQAKDYILSVEGAKNIPPKKIAIQQNILLSEQVDINKFLKQPPSQPIKITIRRCVTTDNANQFTVISPVVLKEKNESNEDFNINAITKRLENNAVTITKRPVEDDAPDEPAPVDMKVEPEFVCKECNGEFGSQIELLRHARQEHSYPKVVMALSEVKKFYRVKDRSECPICHKPLKTNFRSAFVKHLHTHTNEMNYFCKVCRKKFRRHDHMKAHEKRHIVSNKK